jgi:hypothetical protein
MQDNTLVILGVVGLALVCGGLFLFVALTLFRATGSRLLSYFSLFTRDAGDEGSSQTYAKSPAPNLRAIAQANDFDSALAKHVVQDEIEPHAAQRLQPPPSVPSPFDVPPTPRLGARRSTRPELRHDDDDADLFGGLLEDDQEI